MYRIIFVVYVVCSSYLLIQHTNRTKLMKAGKQKFKKPINQNYLEKHILLDREKVGKQDIFF